MKYLLTILALLFLPILAETAFALTCAIRENSCNVGEVGLFSMVMLNNSHVGHFDNYTYKVCCDFYSAAVRNNNCNADEGEVLSYYAHGNAHAAQKNYYTKRVCAKWDSPVDCTIKSSCDPATETCVVSLYSTTNSHVAECNYYSNQVCCGKLPDLYVNQTSISPNKTSPVVGDATEVNITVFNIGDRAATNVNVSCYDDDTFFDSYVINSVPPSPAMAEPRNATCIWNPQCPTSHNISVKVDPDNSISEYNETNNEAWKIITLTEKLNVTIDSPTEGQNVYRGQTINLWSTVNASCAVPTGYTVTWYNSSQQIATGEDTTWLIPLDDSMLGSEQLNATATKTGYAPGSKNVTINILNNLPQLTTPGYNVTPAEILAGEAIEINCTVTDVEDPGSVLEGEVNVSVKNPNNEWSNVSASRQGDTFYRIYSTTEDSVIGYYTAVCAAMDTDNGYNESATSQFTVYKRAVVIITLNVTEVWWNDPVNISIEAKRADQTPINNGPTTIKISTDTVCTGNTNSQGRYSCEFTAPGSVGNYNISANVTDPTTNKIFFNSTILKVKISYGGTSEEVKGAEEVGCYQVPRIVQNPDGSIKKAMVKVCVWK